MLSEIRDDQGSGGTGKSVLIALEEEIIGKENCVNISIQDLNKRFYATSLFGMLLNACADIPSSAMQSVDVLKKGLWSMNEKSRGLCSPELQPF